MDYTYLLIAYKPDSSDYCRGCHMASYSSDFVMEKQLDRNKLIEKWAEIEYNDSEVRSGEATYEVYIFKDNIQVWPLGNWDGIEKYNDFTTSQDKDELEIVEIHTAVSKLKNEKIEKIKHKQLMKKQQELKKQEEYDKKCRQQQFEKLKKEFENDK